MKRNKLWALVMLTLIINGGALFGFGTVTAGGLVRSIECKHWIARVAGISNASSLLSQPSFLL